MIASHAWKVEAEFKAMELLSSMITKLSMRRYILTGGFLETSPRSNVTYWFRKNCPTIAMSDRKGELRVLACLCLHPLAHYDNTFAGAMVPSDDIVAHLTMMRGDERRFWAKANHHPIWSQNSGV